MGEYRSRAQMKDCTPLFLRYREVARLIWNLGFWPDPELRRVDCLLTYEEAMARLFEGMVLLRVGYDDRVQEFPSGLGKPVNFRVTAKTPGVELHVDRYPPGTGTHEWGSPVVKLSERSYRLRFMGFFDWDPLALREYRDLRVLIEQLDERPELMGHLAIVGIEECSVWLVEEDDDEAEPANTEPTVE